MNTQLKKLFRSTNVGRSSAAADSRRSFMRKMGAGVSTALASTAGMAATVTGNSANGNDADSLALQLVLLEEEKALLDLHSSYENAMDQGAWAEALALFVEDAEVIFNGGVFRGKEEGISRLFQKHFDSGMTGQRMGAAPGFAPDTELQRQSLAVSPDRLTATAQFPYSIRVGRPLASDTSLAGMARLQGEGVHSWWEGGVYRVSYSRDAQEGEWHISKLEYLTLSRADYRTGRSWAGPITVAPFSAVYPQDQAGPDRLV